MPEPIEKNNTNNTEIEQKSKKTENPLLEWAWTRFGCFDREANQLKSFAINMQRLILVLGGLAAFFALAQTELVNLEIIDKTSWIKKFLHLLVIVLPITVSILVTNINRFKPGSKWIQLRAGAEGIKREIFLYRVHRSLFNPADNDPRAVDDRIVAENINSLCNRLIQTDISRMALPRYEGSLPPPDAVKKEDSGFDLLTAEKYVKFRLEDQLNYCRNRNRNQYRQLKRLEALIYISGGLGTLLAAVGFDPWVALTTTLVGSLTTYLEYRQLENNIMLSNQTGFSLENILGWWLQLTDSKKEDKENIYKLVNDTEDILMTEHKKWVQQMEEGVSKAREKQAGDQEKQKDTE